MSRLRTRLLRSLDSAVPHRWHGVCLEDASNTVPTVRFLTRLLRSRTVGTVFFELGCAAPTSNTVPTVRPRTRLRRRATPWGRVGTGYAVLLDFDMTQRSPGAKPSHLRRTVGTVQPASRTGQFGYKTAGPNGVAEFDSLIALRHSPSQPRPHVIELGFGGVEFDDVGPSRSLLDFSLWRSLANRHTRRTPCQLGPTA